MTHIDSTDKPEWVDLKDWAEWIDPSPVDRSCTVEQRQQAAMWMLIELDSSRLVVNLVPNEVRAKYDRGMYLRKAVERNCDWYRDFCGEFAANRSKPRRRKHHDTLIKRRSTLRALNEISEGRADTLYAQRLLPFVDEYYWRHIDGHDYSDWA